MASTYSGSDGVLKAVITETAIRLTKWETVGKIYFIYNQLITLELINYLT